MKKIISGAAVLSFALFLCSGDVKTLGIMAGVTSLLGALALYLNRKNIF